MSLPRQQATLAAPAGLAGAGLHTGRRARVTLCPAPPDHGIRFAVAGAGEVAPGWEQRVVTRMNTALDLGQGRRLRTIEHLMAALVAQNIDNCRIEVEGDEIPILDGSAAPWCALIARAGIAPQPAPRRYLRLLRPLQVAHFRYFIRIEPHDGQAFDITADTPPRFGVLAWRGAMDPETFRREIAPARSSGDLSAIWRALLHSRLARRVVPADRLERMTTRAYRPRRPEGRLANPPDPGLDLALPHATISGMHAKPQEPVLLGVRPGRVAVVMGDRILGGARFPDEPVRHKLLDLIGDLGLLGAPLLARVVAHGPTHTLAWALAAAVARHPDAVTLAEPG
jgi:UDP-3-O-[3-hydroxymyristoyl] N-acetylglucosamine deacetylase